MIRKIILFLSFVICLALLGGAAILYSFYAHYHAPGALAEDQMVLIARGRGVHAIARDLESAGVIDDVTLFRVAARMRGDQSSLKAGEYLFPAHIAMRDVFERLVAGDVYHRRLTVPEGLTSWQVVQLLNGADYLSGEPISDIPPEGTLLPETYSFVRGDSRLQVLNRMENAMRETLAALYDEKGADFPGLDRHEIVTLASIIEKETSVPAERRRVAGVFHNRLRIGMPMQSDPTVIYALTGGVMKDDGQGPLGRRLLRSDWQYDSPYNTYKYNGLPPGPIANPGRASLAAALDPEEHDYLYFVADGTGGHAFSRTLEGHNRNVAAWRRFRASQGE